MRRTVDVVSLLSRGRVPFKEALRLQKEARGRVQEGGRETLLLLEHADVITLGRNASRGDLLASPTFLEKQGIAVVETDRGGRLTYHGPGQLVAYPILNLAPDRCDIRRYVRDLEEVLIRTVADFGVAAERSSLPGRWSSIWVGNEKLAAIGIHLSRWVTTHGVALNVRTDLARFSLIIPCGIADAGVTSLEHLVRDRPAPALPQVAESFVHHFMGVFDRAPAVPGDEKCEEAALPAPRF